MARASTQTLVSLDRFAAIIGTHPLHFNQIYVPDLANVNSCDSPIYQYAWQAADKVGREEIAFALSEAEFILAEYLGFSIAPTWEVEEHLGVTMPGMLYNVSGLNARGQRLSVQTSRGYVISGGREAKTLIDDDVSISYSDTDNDGYSETATVTVTTDVVADEIAVYYPGESDYNWEIKPVFVTVESGVATIKLKREHLLLPELTESLLPTPVNGTIDGNFLSAVDVYRKYNDPSQQLQMIWEAGNNTYSAQYGSLSVRNARNGIVTIAPGTWNSTTNLFDYTEYCDCRVPDRVRLWYKAGLTGPQAKVFERAVCYLALTYLDNLICACPTMERTQTYWKEDYALRVGSASMSKSFGARKSVTDNPLGTTRAAEFAWTLVRRAQIGESLNA